MKQALIVRLAIVGLLLAPYQTLLASTYKVEVIVFEHKQPHGEVFEQTQNTLQAPAQTVEIASVNDSWTPTLPEEPLSGLSAAYEKISQQSNYEVLLNKAWLQTVSPNAPTPAAHLQSVDRTLNGYINLMTDGAMTMQVDLEYMPARDNRFSQLMDTHPIIYRVTEKRPLKLNESHYFDHPVLGVIMLITPQ